MVEDIFGGLLEGVAEVVFDVLGEVVGGVVEGAFDWLTGGGGAGNERVVREAVEKYKFLPKD